jgi:hypothetical protein
LVELLTLFGRVSRLPPVVDISCDFDLVIGIEEIVVSVDAACGLNVSNNGFGGRC